MRTDGTFAEFLAHPEVSERAELRGPIGFMAFHAGLEQGTGEIATEAANAAGASLYVAEQPDELGWHVSSHKVTSGASDLLGAFLGHVGTVIAIHGFGRPHLMRSILLGGRRRDTAEIVAIEMIKRLHGFEVVHALDDIPVKLRGLHRTNPVNVLPLGGVQVELPPRVRMRLPPWASHLVDEQREHRAALVESLCAAARRLEAVIAQPPAAAAIGSDGWTPGSSSSHNRARATPTS